MSSVELLPACGVVVFREAIDHGLVEDFAAECQELRGKGINYRITSVAGEPNEVQTSGFFVHSIRDYPATVAVVSLLYPAMQPTIKLALNTQAPWAAQNFHRDHKRLPVATVHASDGGVLDVLAPEQDRLQRPVREDYDCDFGMVEVYDPDHYMTIPVQAGDVAVQTVPRLLHRGRNETETPRATMSLYTY